MKIKIFGDGCNLDELLKLYKEKKINGVTTNPTLMAKAGVTNYKEFAKEVLAEITDLPISFEVFSDDFESMEKEALLINSWGKNINIKIPITNTKGESSVPLIQKLVKEGLKLNVTAVFTIDQLMELRNIIDFKEDIIISIFAGRIADAGIDPMSIVKKARQEIFSMYDNVKILWASTREVLNIIQAEECGCDIITVPPNILSKLSNIGKDLKQFSLETVQMFRLDAQKSGFKIL